MKGLLLKDLYTMRSYLRTLAVMFVFYIVLGFVSRTSSFFAAFVGVLCIVMTVTSYAYDQTCGWNLYGASLPVSRREIVRSKYLLALLLSAAGILVTILAHLLFVLGGRGGSLADILPNALGAGVSGFLIVIILLPVLYRFGVEKGRVVMMILAARDHGRNLSDGADFARYPHSRGSNQSSTLVCSGCSGRHAGDFLFSLLPLL